MSRWNRSAVVLVAAVSLAGAARADTRIAVDLAGRDDGIPKLGMPGIAVHVAAFATEPEGAVAAEIARELRRVVHTRPLAPSEPGDYDLVIRVEQPLSTEGFVLIPFAAELRSQGELVWRITGRAEVRDEAVGTATFAGIGRNVVSALVHDGWVQPRYDPDDPPPAAPAIRIEPRL